MSNRTLLLLVVLPILASASCNSKTYPSKDPTIKSVAKATPTPAPSLKPADAAGTRKAYHITGNIDDAAQEGDVCDSSVPFTVPGTLKVEFRPSSPNKGTYTYSGPFNATGSGPYEIHDNGKMLVSGTGCIMGKCADYSHDWKAAPIDPKTCVTK